MLPHPFPRQTDCSPPVDFENYHHLFDTYAAHLYGIILKNVPDAAIAETLISMAFQQIYNNRKSFNEDQHRPLVWMLGITIRLLKSEGYYFQLPVVVAAGV